jgi:hypothetical protein
LVSEIKEQAYRMRYEVLTAVAWRFTVFLDVTLSISVLTFRSSRLYLVGKESTDIRKDESDLGSDISAGHENADILELDYVMTLVISSYVAFKNIV